METTEPFSDSRDFIPGEKDGAVPKTASSFDGASTETSLVPRNEEGQRDGFAIRGWNVPC